MEYEENRKAMNQVRFIAFFVSNYRNRDKKAQKRALIKPNTFLLKSYSVLL